MSDGGEVGERTVIALSIGARAAFGLSPGTTGRVLAGFSRVCNLLTDGGAVVVLAWRGAELGPMTVLLDAGADDDLWAGLAAGMAFEVEMQQLRLRPSDMRPVRVALSGAAPWESRPPWEVLRSRREQIGSSAGIVFRAVTRAQGAGSGPRWGSRLSCATEAVLGAQRHGDRHELRTAVQDLCGLGEGLTPQGDDWLAGWLLGLRLARPGGQFGGGVEPLGALVLNEAAAHTTLLSRAFLACAAAGEAAESWHKLLGLMARDPADERAIKNATRTILAHGATSGAAMLEGFLAGLEANPAPPAPQSWGEKTYVVQTAT